ncbi:unnamed protein product [Rotaria sp. Silwood2]|nr:unnamed protein product [Rotaria sp. Silwood2]CAF4005486.1 unnamed protein product [Rotaria sp. Silwood2]
MTLSLPNITFECNRIRNFQCNVDNQIYYQQDVDQHQKFLDEQLDWLTVDHDDLRQDLLEQISTPKYHPSMTLIDIWEQESIARIQRTAILARRALIDALDQHVFEIKNKLDMLTPKLREARHHVKFFNEDDIRKWATILQELKQMPLFPVTIDKDNSIHGITIDLTKHQKTFHSELNCEESTPCTLASIIRNPICPISMSDRSEYQTRSTSILKNTHPINKTVKFDDISLNKSQTITPGGVLIIREL